MKKILALVLIFTSILNFKSQNNLVVNVSGFNPGDSIRVIVQKSVESQKQKWIYSPSSSSASVTFNVGNGDWAVFLDATGYYFPTAQVVSVPTQNNVSFQLTPATGTNYHYTWQDDQSFVGHATQVYINEPTHIVVLNDTVSVPSDYSSIKLRNEYGIVLSNDEEPWSNDLSYRLYKMFESLPSNPFGEGSQVNFATGQNVMGVFTLSDSLIYQDLAVTTVNGVKHGRIGIDAFTYASPQIVTVDNIKGKFYSKRLYHVVVNFITDFGANDQVVNWIAQERFGIRFMLPNQETEDLMNEDQSNFQEFFDAEKMEILAMFEELPEGFHKQEGLAYMVRRVNGQLHPVYPAAPAIAWVGMQTIEWMSIAFTGGDLNYLRRLILHEKSHFLWAYSFDQSIKDDWIDIGGWFEDPTVASGWSTYQTTAFVSPYAHLKNPNEDMAESISYYLMNPTALMTVSVQKYEFIRDRIMHGTRYVAMIPTALTFTVYNLFPDYTFPGKVTKVEVQVAGQSNEDKIVTIKLTLHSEGSFSGAAGGYCTLRSSIGTTNGMYFSTQNGQPLDTVLIGTKTFSKLAKSGYWDLLQLRIFDAVGNQRLENTSTLGWKMFLDNPLEDITPPAWNYDLDMEIVQDYFTTGYNTQVSDSVNGVYMKAVKFNYSFYDASPIERAITRIFFPRLDNPTAQIYEKQVGVYSSTYGTSNWINDFNSVKHFEHYLGIPDWYPSGYYAVPMINTFDAAYNLTNVFFVNDTSDFHIAPSQALSTFKDVRDSIYVQTLYPDYIKPEIDINHITITAEPTNPVAPNGETRVDIAMIARDLSGFPGHESGVYTVEFTLRDPLGYEHGYQTGNSTMNNPDLDIYDMTPALNSNWEIYNFDLVLPVGSPPGQWGMSSAQVRDKAGNVRQYSFVEIVRFDIIESDIELDIPLEASILSSHVNASNVDSIDASISCSPCEGLNYVYRIYGLMGGVVVQGTGVFDSDSIIVSGINTSGVLEGQIIFTVQVTDSLDQLVATKSTNYFKDTVYPNSYYTSSNIQNQGISNFGNIIIQANIQSVDVGGTYQLTVQNNGPNTIGVPTIINGNITSQNFNIVNVDYSAVNDGPFTMTLIVTDMVGNVGQPITRYLLKQNGFIYDFGTTPDTIAPVVLINNINVYLNSSGNATISTSQIDNGSSDNWAIATKTLSKYDFNCNNIGANPVKLIVTDVNGISDSATAIVNVLDNIKPTVITQNLTRYLDATGNTSITPAQVDNNSTDNCTITTKTLNVSTFNCSNVGPNTVYLKVTDVNGNIDSTSAVITVLDTIKPTVITQNLTRYLDATGNTSITPAQVDNNSTDNCTIATKTLNVSTFNCSNVGPNTVYLKVTDVNGNIDSTSAVITVLDTIKPTLVSVPNNISLGYCDSVFIFDMPTANDNCAASVVQTSGLPSGSDFPVGITENIFEITDPSGNSIITSFNVEIKPRYLPFPLIDKSICFNEGQIVLNQGVNEIQFFGTGIENDQITFNPIESNTGIHIIDVTFLDSMNCVTLDSFKIEVRQSPMVPEIFRAASDKIITSDTYNYYQWYKNGELLTNENDHLYTITSLGLYSVVVGNTQNCFANSEGYGIGIPVNEENVFNDGNVKLYPNPTDGIIFIEMLDDESSHLITITNSIGIELIKLETISKTEMINIETFAAGTYMVNIQSTSSNNTISLVKQ
jgi:hypothetical protein